MRKLGHTGLFCREVEGCEGKEMEELSLASNLNTNPIKKEAEEIKRNQNTSNDFHKLTKKIQH